MYEQADPYKRGGANRHQVIVDLSKQADDNDKEALLLLGQVTLHFAKAIEQDQSLTVGLPNFPILNEYQIHSPIVSVAGPMARGHRHGIIHRDVYERAGHPLEESEGYFSFFLFLDNADAPHAGSIKFWKDTALTKINERHPDRNLDRDNTAFLYGPAGTLGAWDARILHSAQRNQIQSTRFAFSWVAYDPTSKPLLADP
jgi:hypothetical protein